MYNTNFTNVPIENTAKSDETSNHNRRRCGARNMRGLLESEPHDGDVLRL